MNAIAPSVWSSNAEPPRVSVAWVTHPREGESESGDAVVVRRIGARILLSVIDALGHGPQAAAVANKAVRYLEETDTTVLSALVQGLHGELRGSRGAAALLFVVSDAGVEACSVGNIALRTTHKKLSFVLTPGVLGLRLQEPRVCHTSTKSERGDRFILHSDGISGGFEVKAPHAIPASDAAKHVFDKHRLTHDDATVLVLDVL